MNAAGLTRSARAEEDLIGIWTHIAQYDPAAADRTLDRIEERWRLLATQPRSGAPREELAPGTRHVVVGNYVTLYRVEGDQLVILRVLHGKRDIKAADLAD